MSAPVPLTFIICIKPAPGLSAAVLRAQVASCLMVDGAEVLIGLSHADARLEAEVAGFDARVSLHVLDDSSLYDGWNKAVALARGTAVVFLGHGDCVADPGFYVRAGLDGLDALFARALILTPTGQRLFGRAFNRRIHRYRQRVAFGGAIFARAFVAAHGFDATLKIAGDWEFLLRTGKGLRWRYQPLIAITMPDGGLSAGVGKLMTEVRQVRSRD